MQTTPKLIPPTLWEKYSVDGEVLSKETRVNRWRGISQVDIGSVNPTEMDEKDYAGIWDFAFLQGRIRYEKDISAPTLKIADIFCGAGGLSYGIKTAALACGLNPIFSLAMDLDEKALDVYVRNFDPRYISSKNIWTSVSNSHSKDPFRTKFISTPEILDESIKRAVGEVDILVGGPPCEGHSTFNNNRSNGDDRNKLYIAMPAMAVALGARAVIVENVPGVRSDKNNVLDVSKRLFEANGYHCSDHVLWMDKLGLSQTRKRHVLVASKKEAPPLKEIVEYSARPSRDLRWAISDLVDVDSEEVFDKGSGLSEENIGRINYLFDNDLYNLPDPERPDSHKGGHTYPAIYGRLKWNKPSGTITTGYNTPGRGRYIHPEKRRTLTPHEAARIQGFPDNFEFLSPNGEKPTRMTLAKVIGDAAPPQLGYIAGLAALSSMDLD